ncbi:MAG: NUDIX hydrolase [Ilumatobacteraceae bacterium]
MTTPSPVPTALAPARPAATAIVARDSDAGIEVLLLKRSEIGAFAGMWVFPGGRVDDADAGDDELSRAASAAVREAMEEVSLAVDPTDLIPISHWTPPAIAPKRYTTWFFVAPWNGAEATIDDHEIVQSRWITPRDAFGEGLPMAPPTWVTIASLAEAGSLAGLSALIKTRGVERFVTRPANHAGSLVLLWHGDAGYETSDPSVDGERHRITLAKDLSPRYERSRYGITTTADGVVFHG